MASGTQAASASKGMLWAGRVTSAIPVVMLLFSGVMKLIKPASIVESFHRLGYSDGVISAIGVLEISCTVIYLIPRTAVLGAILVAAYLGGATATNVRIGDPLFVVPAILGVLAWGGLFLRDRRLRALLPLRTEE